jgi:hypothetical protein
VSSTRRVLAVLLASCCALLAFAAAASAREVIYAADGAGGNPSNLYILNPSNGSVVQNVGAIGFAVTGLALDPTDGTLYGSTARKTSGGAPNPGSLIRIDRTTGAGTLVGDLRPDDEIAADLAFTPDGTLYGWLEPGTDDLVAINKATGAATIVGDSGLDTYGSGLASNAAGVLFLAGEGDRGRLHTINRATGAATPVATLNGNSDFGISSLSFNVAGTLFGSRIPSGFTTPQTFTSDLLTIDTATGAITSLGPSVDRLDAIEFITVQSTRTVTFDASKAKKGKKSEKASRLAVKKGKKARFTGQVSAPDDLAGCAANQTVELQRKKPKATTFTTFETLQTDAAGNFSTKEKIKKTFQWQVVLTENQNCDDATSNSEKVKAKKKK